MASVASKIRCRTDEIKTMEITFTADKAAQTFLHFGSVAAPTVIGFPMASIDISADAEGILMYAAKRVVADRATWHSYAAGDKVYYSVTDAEFTTTAANHLLAGICLEDSAAGASATTVEIEFDGSLLARAIT